MSDRLIKIEVQGSAEPDDRGYERRKTLTEIEHVVPIGVADAVIASVMSLLSAALTPTQQREDP